MTANNPTVMEILMRHLEANGFDGLSNSYIDCACFLADLVYCGEISPRCRAGYAAPDPHGDEAMLIVATKGDTDDRE